MKKEISFEDLPLKMQEDWAKYLDSWKNEKIKILSIQMLTHEYTEMITYDIYYEFSNVVGIANYYDGLTLAETKFVILTVGELKEMYRLSSMIKELSK